MTILDPRPAREQPLPPSGGALVEGDSCPTSTIVVSDSIFGASGLGTLAPQPTTVDATPMPRSSAGVELVTPPPAILLTRPLVGSRVAEYDYLNKRLERVVLALNDVESTRKAISNRIDAVERGHEEGGQLIWTSRKAESAAKLVADQRKSESIVKQIGDMSPGLNLMYATYYALLDIEHKAILELGQAVRAHPLGEWCGSMPGVGEKQFGRLLGAIGNPWWNALHDRPRRGPAELWAYAGYHVLPASQSLVDAQVHPAGGQPLLTDQRALDAHRNVVGEHPLPAGQGVGDSQLEPASGQLPVTPSDQGAPDAQSSSVGGVAPKRTKGVRSNWNGEAKMRAFLIAESCVRQKGNQAAVYRSLYERARAAEDAKVHNAACAQCGVCDSCGKPPSKNKLDHAETGCTARKVRHAREGDPLKDSHKHARALRKVAKEVLKDVFLEARRWHEEA